MPEEMGLNFKGEKVEYHGYQAKCVELLRDELARLTAYVDTLIAQAKEMEAETAKARAQVATLTHVAKTMTEEAAARREERDKAFLQVDQMRGVVDSARELIGQNVTRPYVYEATDKGKYKLALALQAMTEKRIHATDEAIKNWNGHRGGCPSCGLGEPGKDALCDKHYSDYLGTNRARGNGPGD
jgi:hypothetical protein